MRINLIYKVWSITLFLFSFFYAPTLYAQCTLQVFTNLSNNDCQGGSNGAVSAVGIFGTPPYTAVWTNGLGTVVDTDTNLLQGQASNATGLSTGIYTVTFTDAAGTCQASNNITVGNITIDTSTTVSGGTISANATGVTYQWVDCNNGMSPISGEISSTFTPTANGDYAVILNKNGCIDASICTSVVTLGTVKNSFPEPFKVYPNPTYGNFVVDFGDTHNNLTAVLYSVAGSVLQEKNVENTSRIQLNIDSAAGMYILKITESKGKVSFLKVFKK